jgi:hypothetical protein
MSELNLKYNELCNEIFRNFIFYIPMSILDMEEFKKGISFSLWDCDCSHYSTKPENIEVKEDEDGYFTIITLHYDNK